jgi:hypothetical protein
MEIVAITILAQVLGKHMFQYHEATYKKSGSESTALVCPLLLGYMSSFAVL